MSARQIRTCPHFDFNPVPLNAADTVCKCYVIKILKYYFLGGSRSDGEHGMEYCSRKCGVANAAGQQCCAMSFPVSHCVDSQSTMWQLHHWKKPSCSQRWPSITLSCDIRERHVKMLLTRVTHRGNDTLSTLEHHLATQRCGGFFQKSFVTLQTLVHRNSL